MLKRVLGLSMAFLLFSGVLAQAQNLVGIGARIQGTAPILLAEARVGMWGISIGFNIESWTESLLIATARVSAVTIQILGKLVYRLGAFPILPYLAAGPVGIFASVDVDTIWGSAHGSGFVPGFQLSGGLEYSLPFFPFAVMVDVGYVTIGDLHLDIAGESYTVPIAISRMLFGIGGRLDFRF